MSPTTRAFSLLEVVLALSLLILLLGASMSFLWQLADRRSTLARGSRDLHSGAVLLERIEADLAAGLVGDAGTGSGIEGTDQRLKLLTRGVWLAATGVGEGGASEGDLQGTEYVFEPSAGRVNARRFVVKPGSPGGSGGAMELVSDRIERMRFRYYDGTAWRDSFNSMSEGKLPIAIEVAVWFTPLKNATAPPMETAAPASTGEPGEGEDADAEVNTAAVDMDDFESEKRWPAPDRLRVIIVPDGPVSSWKEGA